MSWSTWKHRLLTAAGAAATVATIVQHVAPYLGPSGAIAVAVSGGVALLAADIRKLAGESGPAK